MELGCTWRALNPSRGKRDAWKISEQGREVRAVLDHDTRGWNSRKEKARSGKPRRKT